MIVGAACGNLTLDEEKELKALERENMKTIELSISASKVIAK